MAAVILIDNVYEDGYTEATVVTVPTDNLPDISDEDAWADWWEDTVFPLTGTDSGRDNEDAAYFAHIIAASVPEIVGRKHEWV